MQKKQVEKQARPVSIEDKISSYAGKYGLKLVKGGFTVDLDVGEGDFIPISESDYEFLSIFQTTIAKMIEDAQKAKNQTDFLSFCKYFGSRSPELARFISNYTDMIISENISNVESGKWEPVYSIIGTPGTKNNEFYTSDWLRRAKKTMLLEPMARTLKAIYFGRGFVNSGTVDYSADYIADRDSNRSKRSGNR